ncbi:hypothetical protein QFC21_001431 [Naganishia friedmannii]|uniref:Uncharacterized protein n=1 Tax=Naganishia friedmannii TaxID=89922 RepID=A0ACC2W5Z3_9TREE|nr:hypothetical protein QFC21_001431 [Naganishia friedmannii]
MPARTTTSRYRRIAAERSTALLARVVRLPSVSSITFLLGLGASIWVMVGYFGLKIKENALRAASERRKNDRVKTHFQATLSNISFTVYALLPTLSAQLLAHLNVESLTDELKALANAATSDASKPARMTDSGMASWAASSESDANPKSLESSAVLSSAGGDQESDGQPHDQANGAGSGLGIHTDTHESAGTGSSWVQEFSTSQSQQTGATIESDMSDLGATSAGEDGALNSVYSQSISLPPTSPSTSSISRFSSQDGKHPESASLDHPDQAAHPASSPAPASSVSISASNESFTDQSSESGSSPPYLHSPPGSPSVSPFRRPKRVPKGNDLPLRVEESSLASGELHTVQAQAEVLSEEHSVAPVKTRKSKAQLWNEIKVKSEHHGIPPESDDEEDDDVSVFSATAHQPSRASRLAKAKNAIIKPWSYFSLREMGLQDTAEEQDQVSSDGLTGLVGGLWRGLVSSVAGEAAPSSESTFDAASHGGPLHARLDSETERLFLCMSWWFLHVGWRILEEEAERAVGEMSKSLLLKKEMTLEDWNGTINDIRRIMDQALNSSKLLHILLPPPSQTEFEDLMERYPTESACPFPAPPYSPILTELLDQTAAHLTSIDFVYVFSQTIELVQGTLLDQIAREIYNQPAYQQSLLGSGFTPGASIQELTSKKLVQSLPCLTRWSERVWQAVPDEAIDRLAGSHNVKAFTALIYGDFGSDL